MQRIQNGENFTDAELQQFALELGIEMTAGLVLSKLKILEGIAEIAEKSGLKDKAEDILAYVKKKKKGKLYNHNYTYQPRIRERGVHDPRAHNFPYSFDDEILKTTPTVQKDGALFYRMLGTLNGKEGFFEIIVNPTSNSIFHRTFVRRK